MKGVAPLCKGCRFLVHAPDIGPRCHRRAVTGIDVVDGEKFYTGKTDAYNERSYAPLLAWFFGRCGQDGRWFERRGTQ